MRPDIYFKTLLYTILFIPPCFYSQDLKVNVVTKGKECRPGEAVATITGTTATQTVSILWSTGHQQTTHIYDLEGGDYTVEVSAKHILDSILVQKDTVVHFNISITECPVGIPKYFSPNGDGYNDVLNVGRAEYYPNFEFQVFNKWGQKVHGQKKTFTPWDGTWNGLKLPDGTYYYIFIYDASDTGRLEKGDVTILR